MQSPISVTRQNSICPAAQDLSPQPLNPISNYSSGLDDLKSNNERHNYCVFKGRSRNLAANNDSAKKRTLPPFAIIIGKKRTFEGELGSNGVVVNGVK